MGKETKNQLIAQATSLKKFNFKIFLGKLGLTAIVVLGLIGLGRLQPSLQANTDKAIAMMITGFGVVVMTDLYGYRLSREFGQKILNLIVDPADTLKNDGS